MHIGGVQQVMLEVRMAEINRTVAQQIGINFTAVSPSGNFGVNQLNSLASITGLVRTIDRSAAVQLQLRYLGALHESPAMAGWKAGGILWTAFLNLLKQNNLGRVLAEPNLVTTSGQKASFLAGGEFPYPVPKPAAAVRASPYNRFKKYGVQLEFTPTVLDDNKIAMKVHPTVSELDYHHGPCPRMVIVVPGLLSREMNTQVEVHDGQTFAIAGLLSDKSRNVINKFPVLGDIPVLGALFRSTKYHKNETELVALVTSHLVKPIPPGRAGCPRISGSIPRRLTPTSWGRTRAGQAGPKARTPPRRRCRPGLATSP